MHSIREDYSWREVVGGAPAQMPHTAHPLLPPSDSTRATVADARLRGVRQGLRDRRFARQRQQRIQVDLADLSRGHRELAKPNHGAAPRLDDAVDIGRKAFAERHVVV